MTTINKWSKVDDLKDGDTLPIYSADNADRRGISGANAKTYFIGGQVAIDGQQDITGQKAFIGGLVLQSVSGASIAALTDVINTAYKVPGKLIFDTTNNRVMVSSGLLAASPWFVVDGSLSVTPI